MISHEYANNVLSILTGTENKSINTPAGVYLGLCSQEPNPYNGKVTGEPTEDRYMRIQMGGNSTSLKKYFDTPANGVIKNKEEIQFKTARTDWGTMRYFFLSNNSAINSPAYLWGSINEGNGVTISANTVAVFYENDLKASIDVPLD